MQVFHHFLPLLLPYARRDRVLAWPGEDLIRNYNDVRYTSAWTIILIGEGWNTNIMNFMRIRPSHF